MEEATQALRPEPLEAHGLPLRLLEGPIHKSLSSTLLLHALHVTGWVALCPELPRGSVFSKSWSLFPFHIQTEM